jgi:tetratricopeptide (TPR) repeat protein
MGDRVRSPTLVGRIEELQVLEAARRRAADGDPAVVLVGGEAGIGKSRLIAELTARCAADGMRVLYGGCVPVGEGALPYAPIVEALRALLADVGVGAVRELVGPSWPELARLLPAMGAPDRSGPPGQAAQARLFELLLGLLGRLGEPAPLVLVVEDLHWADRSTRDLLAFLARNLRRERLLLVVTYRSDEPGQQRLGPYLAELDRGGPVERLLLARLDRAETAAQLTGILGAVPAVDLVEGVFDRSEGNPFFTEELLESARAGSSTLPTTLRDLLQGRIEALPEPARQILRVAAVAGRQVPHPLLAAVAGLDEGQLDGALREVVAYQLLVPREDGYQFRHALLWEVVDAGLLPGERARLHAAYAHALAEWPELSAGSPAVVVAELAVHWDTAGESARALPARVRAGLAAERAHAFTEAQRHFERALELWELVPNPGRPAGLDRVDLLARAAEVSAVTGAIVHAVGLLEDAVDQVDPAADPVRAGVLLAHLGTHRRTARDEPGALAAFQEAERLLAGAPPSAQRARVLAAHAQTLTWVWREKEAIAYSEEAVAVARAVGARAEEARALDILGACLDHDDPNRAIALHMEARRIAEEIGDAETVVSTYMNLSHVLAGVGRDSEALHDAREGYQRARQLGLERAMGSYVAANLARGLLASGRWEECERLTGELLAGDSWCASELLACRGQLLARRGDFAAAREQLDLALRLSPPSDRGEAWFGLVELALWEGRHDNAGRPSPRASAGSPKWIPKGRPLWGGPPGTCSRFGSRLTAPSGQRPAGYLRRSPRPGGGPRRWSPNWTKWPPRGSRRTPTRTSPASCSSLRPSYPASKSNPIQSDGGRRRLSGSSSNDPSTPPTRSSERPRRCWPAGRPAHRPSRCSAARTGQRLLSGRGRCGARSSCSPSGAASASENRSTRLRRLRHPPPRQPRLA